MQNTNISEQNEQAGLLSIGGAAEFLGISIDTLRRWEKKGKVVAFRSPGGHRYFEKEKLKNLFNQKYTRDEPRMTVKPPAEERKIVPEVPPTPVTQETQKVVENKETSTTVVEEVPVPTQPIAETQPSPSQDSHEQDTQKLKRREELLSEILKDSPKRKRDSLQIAAVAGLIVFTIIDLVLLYLWFSPPKIISPIVP